VKTGVVIRCRDDHVLINEFIAHHVLLGFDTIFIYDNLSSPKLADIINPGLKKFVRLDVDLCPTSNQWDIYTKCIVDNKDYDWIFACDTDEFLWLKAHSSIKDYLRTVDDGISSVAVNWLTFGTSDIQTIDPKRLIMEQFLYRVEYGHSFNHFVKAFVRPKFCDFMFTHLPKMSSGVVADVDFQALGPLKDNQSENPKFSINEDTGMVLVHYTTLSLDFMEFKRSRNITGKLIDVKDEKYSTKWYRRIFTRKIYDDRMDKYAADVRKLLGMAPAPTGLAGRLRRFFRRHFMNT
jgi:hypothetical protein